MNRSEDQIGWEVDGRKVAVGMTRFRTGSNLLLLPALSSISTRSEMRPLQERLGASYATTAIDWRGFGTLPRPKIDWRPELYRAFLHFVVENVGLPIAAGRAAVYALAEAMNNSAGIGRLCLLSLTWRGPLPTMMGKRMALFRALSKAVESKAEMEALGSLTNVEAIEVTRGKLSFYQEFPGDVAKTIMRFLHHQPQDANAVPST